MSISLAWLALALAALLLSGVAFLAMRGGFASAPARVPDEPGALRALRLVTLVGLSAWLIIPGLAAVWMQGPANATQPPATAPTNAPGTAPATAPVTAPVTAPLFTPQQSVLISVIAGAGAAAV